MLGKKTNETEGPSRPARTDSGASVISAGTIVRGDVETDGHLRVEGRVEGDVKAGSVEVGESGHVEGRVGGRKADARPNVLLGGRIVGPIEAIGMEVTPTGRADGGIVADRVTVGGRVTGGITAHGPLALTATAVVEGALDVERISVADGGRLNGAVTVGSPGKKSGGQSRAEKSASDSNRRYDDAPKSAEAEVTVG